MQPRKEFDAKVDEIYDRMSKDFKELDEPTKSMLRTYCVVCAQVDELNDRVQREGYMVEDTRHGGLRENPCVNTVHKLNADKARYFAPLKRVLREQAGAEDDERFEADDEFMGL